MKKKAPYITPQAECIDCQPESILVVSGSNQIDLGGSTEDEDPNAILERYLDVDMDFGINDGNFNLW